MDESAVVLYDRRLCVDLNSARGLSRDASGERPTTSRLCSLSTEFGGRRRPDRPLS
jgi:hypothetical protein